MFFLLVAQSELCNESYVGFNGSLPALANASCSNVTQSNPILKSGAEEYWQWVILEYTFNVASIIVIAITDEVDKRKQGRRPRGTGGTVPPKIWGGGKAHASVPLNILRSSVVGCTRKYEQSKKGVINEFFSEVVVFLVRKGSYTHIRHST